MQTFKIYSNRNRSTEIRNFEVKLNFKSRIFIVQRKFLKKKLMWRNIGQQNLIIWRQSTVGELVDYKFININTATLNQTLLFCVHHIARYLAFKCCCIIEFSRINSDHNSWSIEYIQIKYTVILSNVSYIQDLILLTAISIAIFRTRSRWIWACLQMFYCVFY